MPLRMVSVGKRTKLKVWYVCGEDPRDEIERRFQAAMIHFGIEPEDVEGYLFINSGRESNFVFATEADRKGVTIAQPVVASVTASIKSNGIDVLILDPFVSFHSVPESDNTKVQQVVTQFADIADETGIAIELVCHTRKPNGAEITADDLRGGSAVHDKVRALRTVNRMSEKEEKDAGLDAGARRSYFRLDNGKANMLAPTQSARWRQLVSVRIDSGDDVGVVEAWYWPAKEDLTDAQIDAVLGVFAENYLPLRYSDQAADWAGKAVAAGMGFNIVDKDAKKLAQFILDKLIKDELLAKEERPSPSNRGRTSWYVVLTDAAKKRLGNL